MILNTLKGKSTAKLWRSSGKKTKEIRIKLLRVYGSE